VIPRRSLAVCSYVLLWHCAPAYCSDDLAIIFPTKDLSVNIYVGNLAFTASEDDVRQLFEQYGEVDRVNLITDRETGRARGFGFVDMPDSREAQSAIQGLQGKDLNGRALTVNEAKPREPRRETSRPRW
jgi:RNA recognition motif-containing protein